MTVFVNAHCTTCGKRLYQVTLDEAWRWLGPDHPKHTCWWRRSDWEVMGVPKPEVDKPVIKTKIIGWAGGGSVPLKDYVDCYWCGQMFAGFEELGVHVWNGCT